MAYSSAGAYGNPFGDAPAASGSSSGNGSAYFEDRSRAAYDMGPTSSSSSSYSTAPAPRAPPSSRSLSMGAWGDGPTDEPGHPAPAAPAAPQAQPRVNSSHRGSGSSRAAHERERDREEVEAAEGRLAARRAAAAARAERERAREERDRARAALLGRGTGPGAGQRAGTGTEETGYDYEVDEETERRANRHARAEWVKDRARQQRAGRRGAFEDRPSFGGDDDESEASRVRAMSQEERKARSNMEVLNSSIRVASQANATGADTLIALEQQREQMHRIDNNLSEINDQLTASERILRGMRSWGGAIANAFTRAPAPKPEKHTYKGAQGPQHTAAPTPASRQQHQHQGTVGRTAASTGAGTGTAGKAAPHSSRSSSANAGTKGTTNASTASTTSSSSTASTEEEEIRRRRQELERKRQEAEAEEDAALDTLGDLMQNLKFQAEAMNKELVWGSDMLDHISAETDRANRRIKQSTRTIREIR